MAKNKKDQEKDHESPSDVDKQKLPEKEDHHQEPGHDGGPSRPAKRVLGPPQSQTASNLEDLFQDLGGEALRTSKEKRKSKQ